MVKSTMTETCSAVLRSRRNCSSDGAERTDDGRAFHARNKPRQHHSYAFRRLNKERRSPRISRRNDRLDRVRVPRLDVETWLMDATPLARTKRRCYEIKRPPQSLTHLQVVTPCGGQFISGVKIFRDTGYRYQKNIGALGNHD